MSKFSNSIRLLVLIVILNVILFALNLIFGSVYIPFNEFLEALFPSNNEQKSIYSAIILESRLPQTITALLTGAALSVAGLLLQTLFRNPLAGPGILGISAGASLGVAIFTMISGLGTALLFQNVFMQFGIILAAFSGAALVLLLILLFSSVVKNNVSLLIIGIMVGYAVSAFIGVLQFYGQQQDVHSFVLWGMGSFSQVNSDQLPYYTFIIATGVILGLFFMKPLNALLLGENYAANLGVNVKRTRIGFIILAGMLTAVATAYTGPIAFIGLAVPHLARMIFNTSEHRVIMPGIIFLGMGIAMACNLISRLPMLDQALPINIVTSVFGAPLVIWFLVKNSKINMQTS